MQWRQRKSTNRSLAVFPIAAPANTLSRPKVALVTNIPAPYRVPVWNILAADERIDLTLVFCAGREPNRQWDMDGFRFNCIFLSESFFSTSRGYVHSNTDIVGTLATLNPDVVITSSFNPTSLYAFAYAWWSGRRHICMTDGTPASEQHLSLAHKFVRSAVFKRSSAFIGGSGASAALYRSWGIEQERIFRSNLCIDNMRFERATSNATKSVDVVFCGRFAREKQPMFLFDVAERAATIIGRAVSIAFIGAGELEEAMKERARQTPSVSCTFHGFVSQSELPDLYASARVFLFPTTGDVWGIVASEACAAGLPIISTPHSGAVGDIIVDGINSFVRPLDPAEWATALAQLLSDRTLWERFSQSSRLMVRAYTYEAAADAIVAAVRRALTDTHGNGN